MFYPDYRNPHQNDRELAAFSKEMLLKCLLTFVVILFYISEFLYQIQSSIVQQIVLQNYYNQFQPVFLFVASTVWANLEFGEKECRRGITKSKTMYMYIGGLSTLKAHK